jgi:hypothetical protein
MSQNDTENAMKTIFATITACTLICASAASAAQLQIPAQKCKVWFANADRNKDGSLGPGENASTFYDRVTLANEVDENYVMSRAFFLAECAIGSFGRPPA